MKKTARPPVYLYDHPDDLVRFLPFSASRPIGELRYGAYLLRERLAAEVGEVHGHLTQDHLASFTEPGAPPALREVPSAGTRVFFRSSFVPELGLDLEVGEAPCRFVDHDGVDVGCVLAAGKKWTGPQFDAAWPKVSVAGERLAGAWQIVERLADALAADLAVGAGRRRKTKVPAKCGVIGKTADLLIDAGAMIEPFIVFDTRPGPIWIQEGVELRAFTRLEGPLVVGAGSRIVGGSVRLSSIGPRCTIHGEVSTSVFLGFANKAHDGFLGSSVVGRWANLGAGTTNSNLKNTYGPVRLNLGSERIETGMLFMGSLIGDHVKTAIGTMLPTGCVIGTGANVFGTRRPDSSVPAFAWGTEEPERRLACRMFLQTAARVLPRRGAVMDAPMTAYLEAVWRHATGQPCD